jgi:subtilase family serine protease
MSPSSVAGRLFRRILRLAVPAIGFLLLASLAAAQQTPVPARITQAIDPSNLVVLKGNVHPLAQPQFDRGPAPSTLPLNRMLLVLQRSPQQESALEALLDQQQDKSSPNYHQWLTPQQFGQQFGPADQDIQTVVSWLQSQGFQVDKISNGRGTIEFSGTAGQLQNTFHTAIHKYVVNGETHWANASNPEIPAALAPVVAGIATLDTFYKKPQVLLTGQKFKTTPGFPPEFSNSSGLHALAPGDFATIYNVTPLYSAGINGTGMKIAVVGRSDFYSLDVTDFRNLFGLSSNPPAIVINGPDPGIVNTGEQLEATLDASWAGAVAPNAQIIFVASASTNTTDGVDLSEQYIVDNDLADIMTESFSGCEAGTTSADAASISSLAEQAAAEGITYMVSTGDSGAEGCDDPGTESSATGPLSVNVLASSPYTIGVGGTEFNEGSTPLKYWNSTNSASLSSAISYIPENVWNESCLLGCGQNGAGSIYAGGGGASIYFKKPSWQSSVSGIPADGARDLPDVSLTAAGHDPYLLCFQYSCESGELAGVGGTSASTPSFAGIMALVDQKTASRQGQANYVLYRLAAQETLSTCNGSNSGTLPASTCIFNDTTLGNNAVPGEVGYGSSSAKYQSTSGYDLATGLGSVNAANLANDWHNARSIVSATTLQITPSTSVTHGTPLDVSINVAPGSGTSTTQTPTGDVSLVGDFGSSLSGQTNIVQLTLSNGTATSSSVNQLPGGTYNVQAHYEGDGTFVPSDSSAVQVSILPEASTETASAVTGTPPNLTPFTSQSYGSQIYLQAKVAGQSGVGTATGTVTFTDSTQGSLGSGTLDSTGTATSTNLTQIINAGSHSVTASYSGDASFKSSSSTVNFSLAPAATTPLIQIPSTPNIYGMNPQIIVQVTTNSYGAEPTGFVTAYVGGSQIAPPVTVEAGGLDVPTANSFAYIGLSSLPPGQSSVTVKYSGDSNYQSSTSAPTTVNILQATTTSLTSSSPTTQYGQSVTFTAQVAPVQSGSAAVTGMVEFNLPGLTIGSANVVNGQAQFTTSQLNGGNQTLTAVYSGDTNYGTSSGSFTEAISPLSTTTTLASSIPTVGEGGGATFTAQISSAQMGPAQPTGSVSFSVNGQVVSTIPVANGQAQTSIGFGTAGSIPVQAAYTGDQNYSPSSGTVTETVTTSPPTFSISDNSSAVTVTSPGQSGSTTLTFTAQNGLTGSATLTSAACSNLPSETTCSFSPSTVTFTSSTTTVPVTMTVTTTAPSATMPFARRFRPGPPVRIPALTLLSLLACSLLIAVRRRRAWSTVLALAALGVMATVVGCGGGGGGGFTNPGTPVGNYSGVTVTVTIGSVTQSINTISVNVQ